VVVSRDEDSRVHVSAARPYQPRQFSNLYGI
jgi:hypothetical protein